MNLGLGLGVKRSDHRRYNHARRYRGVCNPNLT